MEPRTEAGRALLDREKYNSRSFALITSEAIVQVEKEAADAALAALGALGTESVGGITEERLLDVLSRLEVDGKPVWFVQLPDDARGSVPTGDMGDERPVARAILAALEAESVLREGETMRCVTCRWPEQTPPCQPGCPMGHAALPGDRASRRDDPSEGRDVQIERMKAVLGDALMDKRLWKVEPDGQIAIDTANLASAAFHAGLRVGAEPGNGLAWEAAVAAEYEYHRAKLVRAEREGDDGLIRARRSALDALTEVRTRVALALGSDKK